MTQDLSDNDVKLLLLFLGYFLANNHDVISSDTLSRLIENLKRWYSKGGESKTELISELSERFFQDDIVVYLGDEIPNEKSNQQAFIKLLELPWLRTEAYSIATMVFNAFKQHRFLIDEDVYNSLFTTVLGNVDAEPLLKSFFDMLELDELELIDYDNNGNVYEIADPRWSYISALPKPVQGLIFESWKENGKGSYFFKLCSRLIYTEEKDLDGDEIRFCTTNFLLAVENSIYQGNVGEVERCLSLYIELIKSNNYLNYILLQDNTKETHRKIINLLTHYCVFTDRLSNFGWLINYK